MISLVLFSLMETLGMVIGALVVGIIAGFPLGIYLALSNQTGLRPKPLLYHVLSSSVNMIRSIPYVILIVMFIPLTRLLVGKAIGTMAATVPLSIACILLMARTVEDALHHLPRGLQELGQTFHATSFQIIRKILLPEAMPFIVSGMTTILINLIGFSAMAGAVGGGGLGDLAIRYGYQRYDWQMVFAVVFVLVVLVQAVQMLGDFCVKKLKK